MHRLEKNPRDSEEKLERRRSDGDKEWEVELKEKFEDEGLETYFYTERRFDQDDWKDMKDVMVPMWRKHYGQPVPSNLKNLDGDGEWADNPAIVRRREDEKALAVMNEVAVIPNPEIDRLDDQQVEELAYHFANYNGENSFIFKAKNGNNEHRLVEYFEENAWKVEEKGSMSNGSNPVDGTIYRVILHKPIGIELVAKRHDIPARKIAVELERKISSVVGKHVEVNYTKHRRHTTFTLPFKDKYDGAEDYFRPTPENDKHSELMQEIGDVFEEHGFDVRYKQSHNIEGGDVRSQKMLDGSYTHKTRETGRYDGSGLIDRPWN